MNFFQKLSAREKNIFYAVVFLLLVLVGYHGVWNPMQGKFLSLDDEIFAMELKLRKARIFLRQREEVTEEAKKYPNLEQMDAGTDAEEMARLLNLIEETARSKGVSITDMKPGELKSDKVSKRFVVEINAESAVTQLIEFIYDLQHSPQILKVEQVNTAPKEEKSAVLRSFLVVTRVVVK